MLCVYNNNNTNTNNDRTNTHHTSNKWPLALVGSDNKQWLWDLRPSIWSLGNFNYEKWRQAAVLEIEPLALKRRVLNSWEVTVRTSIGQAQKWLLAWRHWYLSPRVPPKQKHKSGFCMSRRGPPMGHTLRALRRRVTSVLTRPFAACPPAEFWLLGRSPSLSRVLRSVRNVSRVATIISRLRYNVIMLY